MWTRLVQIVIIFMMIGLFCGPVCAGRTMPAANETTGLTVETYATCKGNFGEQSTLTAEQDNENMQDNPPLSAGETYQMTGYSENTMAVKGNTTYSKVFNYNNANQAVGGNNLDSTRLIMFNADPNGRMSSKEEVSFAEMATAAENSTTCCPFAGQDNTTLPAENTMVQAGSDMDVTKVSALSRANTKSVSDTDASISVHYDIAARGLNATEDAEGSASAFIKVHEQTGRGNETALGADIQFEDKTTVKGLFTISKSMTYDTDAEDA
jgi:hypothetical protein